jgi:RNA polymerase-binding transcription factor DksA
VDAVDDTEVRHALEERRGRLADELSRLTAPPEAGTNLSFGKRIGEGTTEAVERISTTATAQSVAASLADVDRALAKIDEGTYGRCDECGGPIGDERLAAAAWAARCVTCSGRRAGQGRRST